MVKEIECAHCHTKAMPSRCFAPATFALLLILGVIPFILSMAGCALLYTALLPFLALMDMLPASIPALFDSTPIEIPAEVTDLLASLQVSLGIISIAGLVLTLVVGLIPAVIYWAFRHDTYKCPVCEMPIR